MRNDQQNYYISHPHPNAYNHSLNQSYPLSSYALPNNNHSINKIQSPNPYKPNSYSNRTDHQQAQIHPKRNMVSQSVTMQPQPDNESLKCPICKQSVQNILKVQFNYDKCLMCGLPVQSRLHQMVTKNNTKIDNEVKGYLKQMMEKDEKIKSLQLHILISSEKIQKLNQALQIKSDQLGQMHQQKQQLKSDIQKHMNQVLKNQSKLNVIEVQLNQKDNLIDQLNSELEMQRSKQQAYNQYQQRILQELEVVKEESKQQGNELALYRKQMQQLEDKNQQQVAQLQEYLDKITVQDKDIITYRQQLTGMMEKFENQTKINKNYRYKKQNQSLKSELNRKEGKIDRLLKEIEQMNKDSFLMKEKLKSIQQSKNKYEELYNENKREIIQLKKGYSSNFDIGPEMINQHYEQRISELTKIITQKDHHISKLQKQIQNLTHKIDMIGDNFINQKHLDQLHRNVDSVENQMLAQGGKLYNKLEGKTETYFNGKVFEDALIYQLKKDNLRLLKKLQLYTGNNMPMNDRLILTRHHKSEKLNNLPLEIDILAIQKIATIVDEFITKFKRIKQKGQLMDRRQKKKRKHGYPGYELTDDIEIGELCLMELKQYLDKLLQTKKKNRSQKLPKRQNKIEESFQL